MRKNLWVYDLFRADFVRGVLTGDPKRERVRGRSGREAGGAFQRGAGDKGRTGAKTVREMRGVPPGESPVVSLAAPPEGPAAWLHQS